MRIRKRLRAALCLLLLFFFHSRIVSAGIPDVSHVAVTDVTTRSFSVIWAASEPSIPDLEVFTDETGLITTSDAIVTAHPVASGSADIKETAENYGVMKVQVTGLQPDTTYYFKTITISKSTADQIFVPAVNPLPSVTTEYTTIRSTDNAGQLEPFSNDVIIQPCFLDDGVTPAAGTLLLATIEGAKYPVTAFVGDGVDLPNALIDLNNVFGEASHENISLSQGKNLTLLNFRGILGNAAVQHDIPLNNSLSEIISPAPALKVGWNMISLPLDPVAPAIETVLAPIIDNVDSLWAFNSTSKDWILYDKDALPFLNNLNEVHSSAGYWINMNAPASLPVQNGSFPEAGVPLSAGWNLVGYSSLNTLPVTDAISSIVDSLDSIWTFDQETSSWLFYDQSGSPALNTLEMIDPGASYWVYVDEDVVWY